MGANRAFSLSGRPFLHLFIWLFWFIRIQPISLFSRTFLNFFYMLHFLGRFLQRLQSGKESACVTGDLGSIPGSGRSAGGRNGNPLQYSFPENLMDRGAWQATVHGSQRVVYNWVTRHAYFLGRPIWTLALATIFLRLNKHTSRVGAISFTCAPSTKTGAQTPWLKDI